MLSRLRLAALIALALLFAPVAALAQTAAPSATTWDWSPILSVVVQSFVSIAVPILSILIGGLVAKLFKVTDLKQQALVRDTVDQVLNKGVDYAKAYIPPGPHTIDVHNAAVANVLAYATTHAPDALQFFDKAGVKLESMIIARLAAAGVPVPQNAVAVPVAASATLLAPTV